MTTFSLGVSTMATCTLESCTESDTLEIMLEGILLIPASEDNREVVTLKHLGMFDQEDPDESVAVSCAITTGFCSFLVTFFFLDLL